MNYFLNSVDDEFIVGVRVSVLVSLLQDDIYMFGGKLEAGAYNITDEMWVFNIPGRTWSPRKLGPPPPYAVEGHTAHVVELADGEAVMLVFFGYSPIYSYINKVQEYNIRECLSLPKMLLVYRHL